MQVTKMELRGFKSFADKTTLVFDKGITAIVGPNGSGKSNISDAVRWVMGEQNVRQLRGQKADDIIFAGTEKRRPQGAAEVSLYFDNTDHALDTEFTEVVVTRRLFRSGESEFYINKRPCRLKDIHTLFADTGIGQDSMAVIGQNRVDRILNSKPEERRIIFEEVAGISRYKGRKEEGLRKIAETERNLERIQDMMNLLIERLEPMAQEAEKLKRFRMLDSDRISYEGTLTLQELRNYERLVAKAENSRLAAAAERVQAGAAIVAAETERDSLVAEMEREGDELRRLDEAALRAHNELDSLTSRHEALLQRQGEYAIRKEELSLEEAKLLQKQQEQEARAAEEERQQKQKESALAAAKQGLALSETLFHEAAGRAAQAEQDLAALTAANTKAEQDMFVCRHDREDLRRRLNENTEQCNACKEVRSQATVQEQTHRQAADKMDAELQALCAGAGARKETLQEERETLRCASGKMKDAEEQYRAAQSRSVSLEQRIRVLSGMEQEHEGLGRAVKAVLDAKASWRSGICGVVGELCTIPGQLVTALDIALGGASRYIISEDERIAKQAISYLKERKAGRTTFLPLDTVQPRRRTADEEQTVREKGSLGFASDLITYDKKYDAVFSSLLGKTIVVQTMDDGSRIAKTYKQRLRLVALDGTLFNPGGSLTGGSNKNGESSFISRRVLLQELEQQWETAKKAVSEAVFHGTELRNRVEALEQSVREQEQAVQHDDMVIRQLQWQLAQEQDALAQAEKAAADADKRYEALQQVRADIQAQLVAKEAVFEQLSAQPAADTKKLEEACRAAQDDAERCRKTCTEQEVTVAALQEQVRLRAAQIEQYAQWLCSSKDDIARLRERQTALVQEEETTARLLADLAANMAAKEKETKQCDMEKEQFYAAREANFRKRNAIEKTLDELRKEESRWRERLNTADIQLEKYHAEVRRSAERLAMQGLTRQEAMERRREGSLKELQERVAALRDEIAGLGTINPNAETEYRAAVEKEAFYRTQCEDLRESRTKLEAIIAEIDAAMAQQFTQAFAEIQGHFQQIFSRLFGGGAAHLQLIGASDVLSAGIQISIQPPGKKEQQLTLLSGGERALTVIALLLAFLAYHPAPFCLVDEVDAALDEANVERMARYLKNYSGQTQFIVITHRRKTMEAANMLQGVTMEEKGVSRLLTVKIDEVLQKGT